MLILTRKKSSYKKWYEQHKEQISAKRKTLYAENAEYRKRAVEASRKSRRGERTPPVPVDAPIPFAEAAESLGIGKSTLREWRRKKLFPEPKHHNRGLWFTQNQVSLLKGLKAFFQKYRMSPWKIKQDRLKEVRAFISANWG